MYLNPLHCIDFYKVGHIDQYPAGTKYVYSNLTPRSAINGEEYIIWFGLQYFIEYFLKQCWNDNFFNVRKDKVLETYRLRVRYGLQIDNPKVDHIIELHELGYLPILMRALPEGSKVPLKVPVLTIRNTLPEFYWLTNYLETAISSMLWKMSTSATTAFQYRLLLERFAKLTGADPDIIDFQAHDFSVRGMSGLHDAAMSGAGHLTSFRGSDNLPAMDLIEQYYFDNYEGRSIPATEHSVMCAGGMDDEFNTFKRLITEIYPSGNLAVVSDTWDLWKVLDEFLPKLKKEILNRDGCLVIRPDSGDPVEISIKTIDKLVNNFESIKNSTGYTRMNKHLGVIYGDSITLDRCEQILTKLKDLKYSSDNMIFGIGSYTYQYKTRDNLGFAMKATWAQVKGKERILYKDPITDNGNKRSAKGILTISKDSCGTFVLDDQCHRSYEFDNDFYNGYLKTVFHDGKYCRRPTTFEEVKDRVRTEKEKCLLEI